MQHNPEPVLSTEHCQRRGHRVIPHQYYLRDREVRVWCDECKLYGFRPMSDSEAYRYRLDERMLVDIAPSSPATLMQSR